jgi:Na+/H+-dicarboxylate symporter
MSLTTRFRLGAAVALPVGALFIAALYGVDLTTAQLVVVGATSVLVSFSAPGIPGGSILIMAPVLLAVDLPAEGVGILLGVDTIPDMFRTTANVTGAMTAAVVLDPPTTRTSRAAPIPGTS